MKRIVFAALVVFVSFSFFTLVDRKSNVEDFEKPEYIIPEKVEVIPVVHTVEIPMLIERFAKYKNVQLGKTWGLTLGLRNLDEQGLMMGVGVNEMSFESVSASYLGCIATISLYAVDSSPGPPFQAPFFWPEKAVAAFNAWHDEYFEPWVGEDFAVMVVACYKVAIAGPDSEYEEDYVCIGWASTAFGPPPHRSVYIGKTSFDFNVSFFTQDIYAKAGVQTKTYNYRESPRPYKEDEYFVGKWVAGENSKVGVSVTSDDLSSGMSLTSPLSYNEGEEVEIGGSAGQLAVSSTHKQFYKVDTNYFVVKDVVCTDENIEVELRDFDDYSTNGTTWTRTSEGAKFRAFVSGGSYQVKWLPDSGASSRANHGFYTHIVGPIRYHIDAHRYAPESGFDYDSEIEFDVGLRKHIAGAITQVQYIKPNETTDWFTKVDIVSSAGVVEQTGMYHFDDWSAYVKVRDQWYDDEENHEGVEAEGVVGGREITVDDRRGYIVCPTVQKTFDEDVEEYFFPAFTLQLSSIDIDIPEGCPYRPSKWQGVTGVNISGDDTEVWTATIPESTVSRTLVHRKNLRLQRMASKPDPEENLDRDWPIQSKANEYTDNDDAEWAIAVPYEDVTDFDSIRTLALSFESYPAGAVGKEVKIKLDYSLIVIHDPNYTCHKHSFGEEGEFEYTLSNHSHEFSGELVLPGTVYFDLAELKRSNTVNLQRVNKITITLPVAGEYEISDLKLVYPDPQDHGFAGYPDVNIIPSIDPWRWFNDFVGFAVVSEGMTVMNLSYGFEQFQRLMKGLKGIQYRRHCPDSILTNDLTYAKPLSRLINELNFREGWLAAYLDEAIDENMTDDEDVSIGQLYWWDLKRGTGDYSVPEEVLAGKRVGAFGGFHVIPFAPITIHGFYHTGGVLSGMAYGKDGKIVRSEGGTSYSDIHPNKLWQSSDEGQSWKKIGSFAPDASGRYVSPPGPVHEVVYGIGESEELVQAVGNFVNRQIRWQEVPLPFGEDSTSCFDIKENLVFVIYSLGGTLKLIYTSPADRYWKGNPKQISYDLPKTIHESTMGSPSGLSTANSVIYIYHVSQEGVERFISNNLCASFSEQKVIDMDIDVVKFYAFNSNGVQFGFATDNSGDLYCVVSNNFFDTSEKHKIKSGVNPQSQPSGYFSHGMVYCYIVGDDVECHKSMDMGKTWAEVTE